MIVVTTPTGKIGSSLVANLMSTGTPIRLIARDPRKLTDDVLNKADVVQGAMEDPVVLDRALRGADGLFWLVPSPYEASDVLDHYLRFSQPAAEAAARHSVSRVVAVSGLYRGTDRATGPGYAVNAMADAFTKVGVAYRALWSANHMENLLRQLASLRQGFFSLPVDPNVRMPLVATRDVAAVATALLSDTSWTGQDGLPVMGPEDLSHDEMATIVREVTGQPISFKPMTEGDFIAGLKGRGAAQGVAQWLADMFAQASIDPYGSTAIGGRHSTPTTFRQWCEQSLRPALRAVG